MIRLLLDAHISLVVARRLTADGIDAVSLRDWLSGAYLDEPDHQILGAALTEGRVLVSFDVSTIPALVREWARTGQQHAGVVLVHKRTIRPDDIGGLIRVLRALFEDAGEEDWRDRLAFLRPVSTS